MFWLFMAGAAGLLLIGIEAVWRTIRVEHRVYRDALTDADRHGGAARIRRVFAGRLGLCVPEPLFVLGLGALGLWFATWQDDYRFVVVLAATAWLQLRLFMARGMPPLAVACVIAMVTALVLDALI